MIEVGALFKMFFLKPVFIEGIGGELQGSLYHIPTQNNFTASGYFYNIGSGVELKLDSDISLEVGIFIRTLMFSQTEFKTLTDFYANTGINFYF